MMKNLKLERPIAFIDVETTGTHPHSDRIVELSFYLSSHLFSTIFANELFTTIKNKVVLNSTT